MSRLLGCWFSRTSFRPHAYLRYISAFEGWQQLVSSENLSNNDHMAEMVVSQTYQQYLSHTIHGTGIVTHIYHQKSTIHGSVNIPETSSHGWVMGNFHSLLGINFDAFRCSCWKRCGRVQEGKRWPTSSEVPKVGIWMFQK